MPATLAPETIEAEASEHLAEAAGKIRLHDLSVGGLLLAAGLLGYVAAMVALDKWLDLDAWVRQIAWFVAIALLGVIAFRFFVRPLRGTVNPLFTAKLVEETVPDAKNSVVNWVDLHDAPMPQSVRHAVSQKAAKHLASADLNQAIETRSLVWSGAAVAGLVVVLAVLFLAMKPAVFISLVGRAIYPFSTGGIATRTSITLLQPVGGDATITAGAPINIAVTVSGREPEANAADRMRILLRHNPADPNFDEISLESAGNREWRATVPQQFVQNGFWYRVAGGDGSTPEFKVTVRPKPVFTSFELKYDYPAYLNMKPESSRDPHIEAYRGTVVTIIAKANRELKDGRAVTMSGDAMQTVSGVVADDTLIVKLTLAESGTYRLFFNSKEDETNIDSPPYLIRVLTDAAPTIAFKPTQPEAQTLPANGLLTVDADLNDDFGVDSVVLKLKIENGQILQSKPYRGGKSFRREDNTWPTSLEYKDSIKLGELKNEAGAVQLKPDAVIEYWLEASDNCTVPKANIGKSKVLKVRLTAPPTDPDAVKEQDKQDGVRKTNEKEHGTNQDNKNAGEKRPKNAGPQEKKNEAVNPEAGSKSDSTQPQEATKTGEGTKNESTKPQEGAKNGEGTKKDATQPQEGPKTGEGTKKDAGEGTKPKDEPGDKDLKNKADEVQNQIENMKNEPGKAKSGEASQPNEPQPKPADRKEDTSSEKNKSESKPNGDKGGEPGEEKNGGAKPQPANPMDPKSNEPQAGSEKNSQDQGGAEPKGQQPPKAGERKSGDGANASESKSEPQSGEPAAGSKEPGKEPSEPKGREKQGELDRENQGKANTKPREKPQSENDPENLFPDMKSNDPAKKAEAEKQLDELKKKQKQAENLGNAEKDLNSDDAGKKESAGQSLDNAMKEQAKKDADELKKKLESKDPKTKADAEKQVDEMKKKMEQNGGGGNAKDMENAANDLKGNDPAKKDAAGKALDKAVKEQAAKDAEKLANDIQSKDAKTREAAEKKLDDLKKQAEAAAKDAKPGKDDIAKDVNSPDDVKRKAAEQKLNDAMQNKAKQDAEKLTNDLKSKDAATKAAAEKKLDEMKNQAKDAADAAKGMNSPNEAERKAAQEKLDKMANEQAKKDAEKLANDLKSDDKTTREAAEKKLDEMKKQADDLANAAKDLNSPDEAKRKAAEKKLDETVGEQARKDAQQLAKDLQSKDKATREAAEKKVDDLRKQAEEMAKNPPSKEEIEAMKNAAKDLNSPDKEKREKAEKALDEKLGKENRDNLQKELQDKAKPGELPPEVAGKLEDMANQSKSGSVARAKNDPSAKPLEADPEFAKRGGQLQLKTLKEERNNKELLKKLSYTQEEYDRFLKGFEEMLNRQETAKEPGRNPNAPPVERTNVNSAGGVTTKPGLNAPSPQGNGTAVAPPGYADPGKKFENARQGEKKP